MEEKALRGVPWTLLSYAGSRVTSILTTLVLARLVVPADFGVLALATLATSFLSWIADMGFSGTLVLRQDIDRREVGTLLTLMALTGVGAALIAVALSPLAAVAFHSPRLTGVLAAASALLPLGSISGFWNSLLQRELEFRRRFIVSISQSLVAALVSIPMAAFGAGVWSLVVGQLAGTLAMLVLGVALAPYRVRPAFDWGLAREAFRTGRGFAGQGLTQYLRQQVDTISAGAAFGTRLVGFYSMANRLGDVVYWVIAHPVAMVTFPSFAKSRDAGGDIRSAFLRVFRMIALVSCPIGVLLSASAEPFTRVLLGARWMPMAGPLTIMGLWAAARQIDTTLGWLLNSVGRAGVVGWLSVIVLGPLIGGCVLATQIGGLTALALVPFSDTLLSAVLGAVLVRRYAAVSYGEQWRAIRPAVLSSGPTWLVTWAMARMIGLGDPIPALLVSLFAGVTVYAGAATLLEPGILRQAAVQLARMVGRAPATARAG